MKPAVVADQLTKTYKVFARPVDRLLEAVTGRARHRPFRALDGVSFEVVAGEAVGVIGENGAGKSTLLKILTGISMPTAGRAEVAGSVAAILELGSGFHPEFTGRQNIALNAAMLGLDEAQIAARMPSIIDFSELGAFIDQPVKCYSTGMSMRLAFSIAIQVEPDVLIIDEALSVGDGYFQKKCMDEMRRFIDGGHTLLFCSHAMYYVSAFCQRALWLRDGKVEALGAVDEVVSAYESFLAAKAREPAPETASAAAEAPTGSAPAARRAAIETVRLPGAEAAGDQVPAMQPGRPWALEIAFTADHPERALHLGVAVNRASDGIEVCAFGTHVDQLPPFRGRHRYRVRLEIPELALIKGSFTLYVYLVDEAGLHVYDQRVLPAAFTVESRRYHFGIVTMPHRWQDASATAAPPVSGSSEVEMEIEL